MRAYRHGKDNFLFWQVQDPGKFEEYLDCLPRSHWSSRDTTLAELGLPQFQCKFKAMHIAAPFLREAGKAALALQDGGVSSNQQWTEVWLVEVSLVDEGTADGVKPVSVFGVAGHYYHNCYKRRFMSEYAIQTWEFHQGRFDLLECPGKPGARGGIFEIDGFEAAGSQCWPPGPPMFTCVDDTSKWPTDPEKQMIDDVARTWVVPGSMTGARSVHVLATVLLIRKLVRPMTLARATRPHAYIFAELSRTSRSRHRRCDPEISFEEADLRSSAQIACRVDLPGQLTADMREIQ